MKVQVQMKRPPYLARGPRAPRHVARHRRAALCSALQKPMPALSHANTSHASQHYSIYQQCAYAKGKTGCLHWRMSSRNRRPVHAAAAATAAQDPADAAAEMPYARTWQCACATSKAHSALNSCRRAQSGPDPGLGRGPGCCRAAAAEAAAPKLLSRPDLTRSPCV